jgi:hypothetical protein
MTVTKKSTTSKQEKTKATKSPERPLWSFGKLAVPASAAVTLSVSIYFVWNSSSQTQTNTPTLIANAGGSITYQNVAGPLLPQIPAPPTNVNASNRPAQAAPRGSTTPHAMVALSSGSGLEDISLVPAAGTIGVLNQDTDGVTMRNLRVTGTPAIGIANIRAKNTTMENTEVDTNHP